MLFPFLFLACLFKKPRLSPQHSKENTLDMGREDSKAVFSFQIFTCPSSASHFATTFGIFIPSGQERPELSDTFCSEKKVPGSQNPIVAVSLNVVLHLCRGLHSRRKCQGQAIIKPKKKSINIVLRDLGRRLQGHRSCPWVLSDMSMPWWPWGLLRSCSEILHQFIHLKSTIPTNTSVYCSLLNNCFIKSDIVSVFQHIQCILKLGI